MKNRLALFAFIFTVLFLFAPTYLAWADNADSVDVKISYPCAQGQVPCHTGEAVARAGGGGDIVNIYITLLDANGDPATAGPMGEALSSLTATVTTQRGIASSISEDQFLTDAAVVNFDVTNVGPAARAHVDYTGASPGTDVIVVFVSGPVPLVDTANVNVVAPSGPPVTITGVSAGLLAEDLDADPIVIISHLIADGMTYNRLLDGNGTVNQLQTLEDTAPDFTAWTSGLGITRVDPDDTSPPTGVILEVIYPPSAVGQTDVITCTVPFVGSRDFEIENISVSTTTTAPFPPATDLLVFLEGPQLEDDILTISPTPGGEAIIRISANGPLALPRSVRIDFGAGSVPGAELRSLSGTAWAMPHVFVLSSPLVDIRQVVSAPAAGDVIVNVTDLSGSPLTPDSLTINFTNDPVIDWHFETVDDSGSVEPYTSIAVDSNNRPHISYTDSSGNLKYALCEIAGGETACTWDIDTVDSNVGYFNSIAVDSNNYPHISYYDSSGVNLKHAYYDSSWHKETVDSDSAGYFNSIAVDSIDDIHISYYGGSNLKYAYYDSSWHTETVDNSSFVGWFNSIAVDSNNDPHISHYDVGSGGDLEYAYKDSSWHKETVDSTGDVGAYTSIDVDSDDNPHISYLDDTLDKLKYAYKDGSWYKEPVDSGVDIDATSIALDSNDSPHIVYEKDGLDYAYDDGTWHTETLDSGTIKGVSIALDSSDNPHISYQDDTNEATLEYTTPDDDLDGVSNSQDNCLENPNGPMRGTCVTTMSGVTLSGENRVSCISGGQCGGNEVCQMIQSDYNENGYGDVCECYADCTCDGFVQFNDLKVIKQEYNRDDCSPGNPCYTDFNGDGYVQFNDLKIIKFEYNIDGCPIRTGSPPCEP